MKEHLSWYELLNDITTNANLKVQNRSFFHLPEEIKKKYPHPPCANPNRGWVAVGQEKSSAITDFEKGKTGADHEIFDVKVSLTVLQ